MILSSLKSLLETGHWTRRSGGRKGCDEQEMEIRKSETANRKQKELPKVGSEASIGVGGRPQKAAPTTAGKPGDKKRQATTEAKTRKGEERKRKDDKDKSTAKQNKMVARGKKRKVARFRKRPQHDLGTHTQRQRVKTLEKKIGARSDLATAKTQEGVRFERERASGI